MKAVWVASPAKKSLLATGLARLSRSSGWLADLLKGVAALGIKVDLPVGAHVSNRSGDVAKHRLQYAHRLLNRFPVGPLVKLCGMAAGLVRGQNR